MVVAERRPVTPGGQRLPLVPATPELERRLDALLERVGLV